MNAELLINHFDRISEAPDSISRLREFVLDLAVRGKLVDQHRSDEPAQLLAKDLKSPIKQPDVIPPTAFPYHVPPTWIWIPLGEICSKTGSGSTPRGGKNVYKQSGIPFLRSQNIYNEGLRLDDVAYIDEATHIKMAGTAVQPNDLLLNITGGSIGRCCSIPENIGPANVSQHVAIIRPRLNVIQPYLHRLILSPYFQSFVIGEQTGAGRGGLPKNKMDRIPVALAPIAEQQRIVARVDELMRLCDQLEAAQRSREACRDRLTAASVHNLCASGEGEQAILHAQFYINHLPKLTVNPSHLIQLRKAILALAVSGRLVEQRPGEEPAAKLLERIQKQKLAMMTSGSIKNDKELWHGLPSEAPHSLPENWVWTRLQDVFEISRGGSPRPAGDPRYFGGPIPWVTVREITKDNSQFLTGTEDSLTVEGSKKSRFINPGDLLLTNSGATLGVPKISKIRACINDGVAVLRLFHSEPLNDFAYLYLSSQTEAFRRINQGMGQPNLNTPIIAGWYFPLPPLEEQLRIVAKVNDLMTICINVQAFAAKSEMLSSDLLDAVLRSALLEDVNFPGL
jgi:type I restriction enzyme S subunit